MLQPLPTLPAMQVKLPPLTGDTSWIDNPTGMEGIPQPIAPVRPTSNTTGTATPKTPDLNWPDLLDWAKNHPYSQQPIQSIDDLKKAGNALMHPIDTATSLIFTSRLIFLVIGLLLIGAGLFQFRATQTVIDTGTKAIKTGGKIAAMIP